MSPNLSSPTVTVPFVPVPPELLRLNNERNALRSAVATAINLKLPWVDGSNVGVPRKSLSIPATLRAHIAKYAEEHGMDFQDAFAGLARAGIAEQLRMTQIAAEATGLIEAPPFQLKPGPDGALQRAYWQNVMGSLTRDRVVVAEGSTGLGKGRVIAAAALERALRGATPVYVVAPTLKIVAQLWSEYEGLMQENGTRWAGLRVRFLPGMTEFASPEKIERYILECTPETLDKGVADWFAGGGQVSDAAAPLKRAIMLSAGEVPMNFLMDDLRAIATEVEPNTLACDDDEDPRVVASRKAAADADIVYCTHAMLVMLHKRKWSTRPRPACIIIDEAHEFERVAASVHSSGVALRSLRRKMDYAKGSGALSQKAHRAAAKAVDTLYQQVRTMGAAAQDTGDRIRLSPGAGSEFWSAIETLHTTLNSESYDKIPEIRPTRMALSQLIKPKKASSMLAWIEFSPKRAYPSLHVGRANLGGILGSLWSDTRGGVALCSATLLIPDASGNRRADYIRDVLALPRSRTDVPPSVIMPSVLSIPMMHIPKQSVQARMLSRPNKAQREAHPEQEAAWLATLGRVIHNITERKDVAGGTLVLLSSFQQVEAVSAHIAPERLIVQSSKERFADTQMRYEMLYRSGVKPVMLGVGTAWIGVDLSDKAQDDPEKDFMLTDLIIGCMPVGLNRSASMISRVDRMGTMPIEKEALMMLKQGLGRLIRRAGVKARHIWFLDGRLWCPWPGMERFQASARLMLSEYKQQGKV